ncbi:polyphosphate kinase [Klebsiella pneumoniae subsp. pneumoniae]|nr:polyphosphate kinase [Klebsiella pneumoniae subsp. pneumoniae]
MGNKKSGNPVDTAAKIAPLDNKAYEKALRKLHVELVKLQRWVVHKGLKVCIVFEGRDGAGKGGTIKAITERVSPRIFRVVALPSPTEREKSQLYFQRYIKHLPAAGEIVIFDRCWYNRAGVERVMGFCTPEEVQKFLDGAADGGARHGRIGHYSAQVLAGGLSAGAGAPSAGSHRRRA